MFSIVIPTLNEEKFLPGLLEDLAKQTFKQFEVIHVDGNSDDATQTVAQSFSSQLHIETIAVTQRNVSFQRNTGAKHAHGAWIIFMDADDRVKKTFLHQLTNRLEEKPDTDVFACQIETQNLPVPVKHMMEFSNISMLMTAQVRPFAAGALIGIQRSKMETLCFNCEAKMSEDHQFVEDAVKAGCKYRVFRQPKYVFSTRRFEKEGLVKISIDYLRSAAILLAGPRFERFLPDYPMDGGTHYDYSEQGLHGLLPGVGDIIRRTSKRQQLKLKSFVLNLQELINDL